RSTVPRNSGTLKFCNKSNHLRERPGAADTPCAGARRQASSISAVRQGLTQVPIRSGVLSLRRAATTESTVIRPVRGFSEGTFSIARVKRAESLSTSTVWQLRATATRRASLSDRESTPLNSNHLPNSHAVLCL